MKVSIKYTQTGMYKDYVWQSPALRTKGQVHEVTPSEAARLIKLDKAELFFECDTNSYALNNAIL